MTAIDIPTNFKTTLAPRKRAKTQEEKEQRRIERILRNRKAAHASREKKRKHVEFLEKYVLDLEKQLGVYSSLNENLMEKYYQGGDAEIDKLVSRVSSLPDLQQMKHNHNIELEEAKDEVTLPRTPESYTSSPAAQTQDFDNSELDTEIKVEALDSVPELTSTGTSPVSSPKTTNKFSLNIIGGVESFQIKQEEPLPLFPKDQSMNYLPNFNNNHNANNVVNVKEEHLQELGTDFSYYMTNDFDELRNPEAPSNTFDLNDFVLLD